jgi:hypothetical protein
MFASDQEREEPEDSGDEREPPAPETGLPGDPDVEWNDDEGRSGSSLAGDPDVDYEPGRPSPRRG